jgi:hypothetical protein
MSVGVAAHIKPSDATTASSVAMTRDSLRPSDESPQRMSDACSGRKSRRRNAR